MTRKKASLESLKGRKVIRKRTLRRYAQREIAHWLATHPGAKLGGVKPTVDPPGAD